MRAVLEFTLEDSSAFATGTTLVGEHPWTFTEILLYNRVPYIRELYRNNQGIKFRIFNFKHY